MDAAIRYCTTPDGVRIGYKVFGEGRPLVMAVPWPGSIEFDLELDVVRAFYEALVAGRSVVRFDLRGSGASQRGVTDFSVSARARDLGAVCDHLKLEKFDLFGGPGSEAQTVISYCAQYPERVTRLILWEPAAVVRPPVGAVVEAERTLIRNDWHDSTRVFGRNFTRGWSVEQKRAMTRIYRETLTADTLFALQDIESDVSTMLGGIRRSTLILHARSDPNNSLEESRDVAARIQDARLVTVEGDHAYFFSWHEQIVPLIREFLGDEPIAAASAPAIVRSSPFRTVLFTDVVGHTEMMQRLGDAGGREVLREHERITRETLKQHHGVEVKTMGDGFMASFASVTSAMECAVALQRAFAAWNADRGSDAPLLEVRVGLNAGEPIEDDGDLFGATVIMASRVAAQAAGGEILIPEPVRHLLAGKGFVFADRGETMLKGFEDAVRLFEVRWRE
jgi:class 3 adenylate cyclase/pimeloyl-ACP methyl ester carboxylesterase